MRDTAGQGPNWAALRKRAPPGRRPRTARASPAPRREARTGTPRPRVAGRDPGYLPGLQEGGPARSVPPRLSFPRARPVPTPPYLPAAATAAQPGLAPSRAPPPPPLLAVPPRSSAPIRRVRTGAGPRPCPPALLALAALHPGNARPGSRDGRGPRESQRSGEPPQNSSSCSTNEPRPTARTAPDRRCVSAPGQPRAGFPGKACPGGLNAALTGEGRGAPVAPPFPTPKHALIVAMSKKPCDSQRAFSVRVPQGTASSGLVSLA